MKAMRVFSRDVGARLAVPALCAFALAAGTAGVASAYYTSQETVTNTMRTAEMLEVRLEDPAWDALTDSDGDGIPDVAESMLPGQSVPKSPNVVNVSGTAAYAYIVAKVPTAPIATIGPSGDYREPATTELFSFEPDLDGWVLLEDRDNGDGFVSHVYAYRSELNVGEATTPLFQEVVFVNAADQSEVSGATFRLSIEGSAIQSAGFDGPEDAWRAYVAQSRSTAGRNNG